MARSFHRALLGVALLCVSRGALAQTPEPSAPAVADPDASNAVEELIITGTRIRRVDVEAGSAVVIVGEEELRSMATVNAEDAIRELPMALPGVTPFTNNGNPGAATVNLRGLDDERTLVLVDGKRFVGYDAEGIVDINDIPAFLIERVDVVTGGASAVYGSDAIAGVVNFVLKHDFEGARLGATYTTTTRGDAGTYDLNLTLGHNFSEGRGNVTLYTSWTDRNALSFTKRSISQQPISSIDGSPVGSLTDMNGAFVCEPAECQDPGRFGPEGIVGFDANGELVPQTRRFNVFPYSLFQVPQQRVQATALGRFELRDEVELYGRASFARTEIDTAISPSGSFGSMFDFPLDYPFWTPQALRVFADRDADGLFDQLDVNGIGGIQPADFVGPAGEPGDQGDVGTLVCPSCAGNNQADPGEFISATFYRRTPEVGSRIAHLDTRAYQVIAGLRGELPWLDGWTWDLSYQYGRTKLSRHYENDVAGPRLQDSLDGCPAGAAAGCVVGNFFGDGSLGAATADFIRNRVGEDVETDQQVLAFALGGDLGESIRVPRAAPIGVAVGFEWRRETSESDPSTCFQTPGCSTGFGTIAAVANEYSVSELFAEALVPLLEKRRFAQSLQLEAGVRYARYSTAGNVLAVKGGGSWAPLESLRLRGMFQRAVRAPNIYEFGSPVVFSEGVGSGDPCAAYNSATGNTTVSADTRNLCVDTGVPAAFFTALPSGDYESSLPDTPFGDINTFVGGNPDLAEEQADTLTLGFVYEPHWLEDASLQVDWYRAEVRDAIEGLTPDDVLSGCYDEALNPARDPSTRMCGFVRRDPYGGLWGDPSSGVVTTAQNVAKLVAAGVDLSAALALDLGAAGRLDFSLLTTFVTKRDRQAAANTPITRCVGKFGIDCAYPNPGVRFTQRTTWHFGDFSLGYRWRFIDATEMDQKTLDFDRDGVGDLPTCLPEFCEIGTAHYFDLWFAWQPSEIAWLADLEIVLGIENLSDRRPPEIGSYWGPTSGNTYPDTYDPLGRVITLSVSKTF